VLLKYEYERIWKLYGVYKGSAVAEANLILKEDVFDPVNIIDQHHGYCLDIRYVSPHFLSNTSPSTASALPQFRTR